MLFLRAAEKVNLAGMARAAARYPHLRTFVQTQDPNLRLGTGLNPVRAHVVDLAQEDIYAEVRALREIAQEASDTTDSMKCTANAVGPPALGLLALEVKHLVLICLSSFFSMVYKILLLI